MRIYATPGHAEQIDRYTRSSILIPPTEKCHSLYGTYNTYADACVRIARMSDHSPKKPAIKTAMRIPANLHQDLQDAAAREGHSMNAEIISRLTAAAGGASLAAVFEQNKKIMSELAKTQAMIETIISAIGPRR